jgi:hypothetical protein
MLVPETSVLKYKSYNSNDENQFHIYKLQVKITVHIF